MNHTIVDYLYHHATHQPNEIAFRFLNDTEQVSSELTFQQLWQASDGIASFLTSKVQPGSTIMLLYPPGLDYIKAFYGCLIAGMIAVPLYPPRANKKSDRIINVAQSCQAPIALTTQSELTNIETCWQQQNSENLELAFYPSDNIAAQSEVQPCVADLSMTAPAFLQYTSGSTGVPKGVIITHGNIVGNVNHLSNTADGRKSDVFVNWLPLFHDLGLITAILWPVYLGSPSILMAPATFIRNPYYWLKAISDYRGTKCGAPNFAYDLCTNKVTDEQITTLDLSSWRVAYNAAEPVKAATLNGFSSRFSDCGFSESNFYPGYGMAEATVFITGGDADQCPEILSVDKQCLAEKQLILVDENYQALSQMVSCGRASYPHDVRVVDPVSTTELAEGQVGEVWFSGPSVSPGYWQLPELSADTFGQIIEGAPQSEHRYLRTGDLGVMWNGELYITGRMKDLIILRGTNYYPQDIEASTVNAHPAIRMGYCAAFAVVEADREKLVVVTELERSFFRSVDKDEVINAIRQQILVDHQVNVDQVVLLKPYVIPVTSSGKIQRARTRLLLLEGALSTLAQSSLQVSSQLIKPNTEAEQVIHDIWCQTLNIKQVSIEDNFFNVGGDSVTAIQICADISRYFNTINVAVEQLLDLPTIKELAEFIDLQHLHSQAQQAVVATKAIKI